MKKTFDLSYEKVLKFAKKKHKGQLRKDGKTPYIEHPIAVANYVKKYKGYSKNIDVIVAGALLHDTLEDTYTSYRELEDKFGIMVASLVMEITSAGYVSKIEGKSTYLKYKMARMTKYALVVKLADRLANIVDVKALSKEVQMKLYEQTEEIIDYLEENAELTSSHKQLIEAIEQTITDNKKLLEE